MGKKRKLEFDFEGLNGLPKDFKIKTVTDVKKFFHHLVFDRKVNFHPDDDFSEYVSIDGKTPTFNANEVKQYNRLMKQAFDVCEKNGKDIYEIAMDEFNKTFKRSKGMNGLPKGYQIKPGDNVVKWVADFIQGGWGKDHRTFERSQGTVVSVDGDDVKVKFGGSETTLSKEKLKNTNLYETIDDENGGGKDIYYTVVPEGFDVADFDEIPKKVAEDAYRNTSFSNDKRGFAARRDWEQEVNNFASFLDVYCKTKEQKEKAISLHKRFHDKTKELLISYLYSHANCISAAIVGPSKFPVRRAEKANNAADKKLNEYIEYISNAKNKYPKIIEETLTEEEKESGMTYEKKEFFRKLDQDLKLAKQISEQPKGSVPSYIRTNMNSALLSRLDTLWRNRDYDTFNKALDKIKDSGLIFSKTNAIWERHANTPTSELYQSPEFKKAMDFLQTCEEKLTKERYEKDKEDIQWYLSTSLNSLWQQQRIRSIKILLQRIKDVQDKTGFELWPANERYWNLLKEEKEEVEAPSAENPEGGTIYEADGCEVVDNIEQQRVQILFPGKPSAEIISYLKSHGFRWSPFNKAWQRQNTPEGRRKALEFAKKFFPKEKTKVEETKEEIKEDNNKLQLAKAKMKMAAARLKLINIGMGDINYEMD